MTLKNPVISPELDQELSKTMRKPIIRHSDMNSETTTEAVDIIVSIVDKSKTNLEECAKQIKDVMDKRLGGSWHCIVGEQYGFEITHEQNNFLYLFYQGNISILLFKC
mmetsp:Transcript_83996/g.102895  ORF Transcript_83996/g.102895 Transcript_83996/m.102895 type:complete len:108 (-) Transcript_83996:9-332(-)